MVHRAYRIGGFRLGLRTTSHRFGEWLDEMLAPYRVRLKGDAFYYSIVVGDDAHGPAPTRRYHILYKGTVKEIRTLELSELARVFLADLESFMLHRRNDAIYPRASVVSLNGSAAIVPAYFGSQLAGLGRRLQRSGLILHPAPAVAVDHRSGSLVPIHPRIRVPDRALDRLSETFASAVESNGHRSNGVPDIGVVFTLAEIGAPPVRPISKAVALYDLASRTANLGRLGPTVLNGLGRLVRRADCFAMELSSPQCMLDALVATMSGKRE